ncbi:hypothetical protein IWW34DRAFT_620776 [Fusarium oxysporum f. sp. albedinis]|nr:hypothetical protein IWW34DRAFT_620776 [Fusarium oxysporum f. sp. albedinis]
MPFTNPPHVRLYFSRDQGEDDLTRSSYTFLVDTGSTGIVTRADRLKVLPSEPITPHAYLFLSSSKTLYRGFWVNRWVWFNKGTESEVRAQAQVLTVEYKCPCPTYVIGQSGDQCPSIWGIPPLEPQDGPISLMGIGFGRTYDGQEQSTPDKNVLLNVKTIGGMSITDTAIGTTYSPGWIIDKDGITLGLTDSNWHPFDSRRVPLPPPARLPMSSPRYMWQWGEIPGTYTVAGFTPSDCNNRSGCSILIDTGIGYASARGQVEIPADIRDPRSHHLVDRQSVAVSLGLRGASAISESFQSGSPGDPDGSCSFAPEYVKVSQDSSMTSGYNTGSHMLRKWRMAIDFMAGVVGFVEAVPAADACWPIMVLK